MGAHDGEPWSLGHLFGGQPGAGRLPAELLFSDRDFTDADYETLLALDDSIVKKGAHTTLLSFSPASPPIPLHMHMLQAWLELQMRSDGTTL